MKITHIYIYISMIAILQLGVAWKCRETDFNQSAPILSVFVVSIVTCYLKQLLVSYYLDASLKSKQNAFNQDVRYLSIMSCMLLGEWAEERPVRVVKNMTPRKENGNLLVRYSFIRLPFVFSHPFPRKLIKDKSINEENLPYCFLNLWIFCFSSICLHCKCMPQCETALSSLVRPFLLSFARSLIHSCALNFTFENLPWKKGSNYITDEF